MMLDIEAGTTSKRIPIKIRDTSKSDGSGLAGLVFNSSGLTWYYWREDAGNVGGTSVTLATATLGTFASGGFKEKDATNLPGLYEIGIPDAALAVGAKWVQMTLKGAANMEPVDILIQLSKTPIQKNMAFNDFEFVMYDSAGAPKSGLTITAKRSIDGAAYAACANAASEVGTTGTYKINLAATDLNGGAIMFEFDGGATALKTYVGVLTRQ